MHGGLSIPHAASFARCVSFVHKLSIFPKDAEWYVSFKVCHSSNLLYQGFAEKYFLGIYLNSTAENQKEN